MIFLIKIFDFFQNKISKKPIPKVKKSKMETFSRIWPKSVRRGSGRKKSFIDSSSRTRFLSYGELLVCFGNFTGTNDSLVVMLGVFLCHALIGISMDCTTSLGWTHSLSRFQKINNGRLVRYFLWESVCA